MKLVSKAKPVKIRIKSGKEEHSSLASLKCNFSVADIKPLLDGRIVRWLRQQGENELAEVVNGIDASSLDTMWGVMYLMKVFFQEYIERYGISDLLGLLTSWLKSTSYRKNGEELFYYALWDLYNDTDSIDLVKYLYRHKDELECPETDWYLVFMLREEYEDRDPEVLYIVGKMLWEGYQFNDIYPNHYKEDTDGLELIREAARLGCQEANLFVLEYNRKQKDVFQNDSKETERFAGVDKTKIKRWIDNKWEETTGRTLKFSSEDYANAKERIILNFICQCHTLLDYYNSKESWDSISQKALFYFFYESQSNDILAKEKWFICGLIRKHMGYSMRKTAFTKAGDYPPAQYMLSNRRLINGSDLKNMEFPSQVSFVIRCLFDYE